MRTLKLTSDDFEYLLAGTTLALHDGLAIELESEVSVTSLLGHVLIRLGDGLAPDDRTMDADNFIPNWSGTEKPEHAQVDETCVGCIHLKPGKPTVCAKYPSLCAGNGVPRRPTTCMDGGGKEIYIKPPTEQTHKEFEEEKDDRFKCTGCIHLRADSFAPFECSRYPSIRTGIGYRTLDSIHGVAVRPNDCINWGGKELPLKETAVEEDKDDAAAGKPVAEQIKEVGKMIAGVCATKIVGEEDEAYTELNVGDEVILTKSVGVITDDDVQFPAGIRGTVIDRYDVDYYKVSFGGSYYCAKLHVLRTHLKKA